MYMMIIVDAIVTLYKPYNGQPLKWLKKQQSEGLYFSK